jgi:hypothetical protein
MKDSENNLTPVRQPALVQGVGSALWDVSLDYYESVRDDPNFSFRKADSHDQKFDKSTADASEIEVIGFEEVISRKKRKKAEKVMRPVEQFPPIHVSMIHCSCKGFRCPFTGKNHVTLCVCNELFRKRKDFTEHAKICPKTHDDDKSWNSDGLFML